MVTSNNIFLQIATSLESKVAIIIIIIIIIIITIIMKHIVVSDGVHI